MEPPRKKQGPTTWGWRHQDEKDSTGEESLSEGDLQWSENDLQLSEGKDTWGPWTTHSTQEVYQEIEGERSSEEEQRLEEQYSQKSTMKQGSSDRQGLSPPTPKDTSPQNVGIPQETF